MKMYIYVVIIFEIKIIKKNIVENKWNGSYKRAISYIFHNIFNISLTTGVLFVWFGLNVAFNNLSVISWRCLDVAGSSMLTFRVLPHWNIKPQTLWHDIPPSHIILTLSWPVLIPSSTFLSWAPSERAASTIFKVFGMTRPGIEPATYRSCASTTGVKLHIHLWNVVVPFFSPQFCKSDMSRYGYLEVFQRVPWTSR